MAVPGLTARPARLHAARSASTHAANPCLPNAPPVADAERSASSQPNPSRRKSCPAPTAAEPATTSPQLPGQSRIKPCGPITANPTPGKNGSTSGGTRASAAGLALSACARPNAIEPPLEGRDPAAFWPRHRSNAEARVLRRRHSGGLSHRSWLALPVLVMVWGCAWGRGKPLPFGAARGQSWATSSTIFCCSPVWRYSSRGLSSRPRACSSDAAPLLSDAPRAVCAST